MTEDLTQTFLQAGIPGAVAVALAVVVVYLWRELKAERIAYKKDLEERDTAHKKEVSDHKKEVAALIEQVRQMELRRFDDLRVMYTQRDADKDAIHQRMLEVVRSVQDVMNTTASFLESNRGATIESREASREAAEELRKLSMLVVTLRDEVAHLMRGARNHVS